MVRFLSISAIALFSLAQLAQAAPAPSHNSGFTEIAAMEWNDIPVVANMMERSQVNLVKRGHHKSKKHHDDEDSDEEDSDDEDSDDEDSDDEDSDDEDSDDEDSDDDSDDEEKEKKKSKKHGKKHHKKPKKHTTKKPSTKKPSTKTPSTKTPSIKTPSTKTPQQGPLGFDHLIRGLFDSVIDHIIETTPLKNLVEKNYDFLYEIFTTKVHEIVEDLATHPPILKSPLEGFNPLDLLKAPGLTKDLEGLGLINNLIHPTKPSPSV